VERRWCESVKAVQDAVQAATLVVIFFIVLGVAYFFGRQFEALGLPWPSALDTALSVLAGFVELVMTLYDIRGLVAPIAIFIIYNHHNHNTVRPRRDIQGGREVAGPPDPSLNPAPPPPSCSPLYGRRIAVGSSNTTTLPGSRAYSLPRPVAFKLYSCSGVGEGLEARMGV
jgi:hypothetical protein